MKRVTTVTVVLLDKFQKNVPRECARTSLQQQQKIKKLFVSRSDTHADLDENWIFGIKDYTFLECIKGGNQLAISSNQHMDGKDAINRRGCLYLCKDRDKVKVKTHNSELRGQETVATYITTNELFNYMQEFSIGTGILC